MNEEINTISEEQVLHNELSFEINQELIHLMKLIVEIQRVNKQLKENNMSMQEEIARTWKKADLYKEVIDRILNETKETRNILNNNQDNNMLSKSCLLSYLEIVEDLLKEVSE